MGAFPACASLVAAMGAIGVPPQAPTAPGPAVSPPRLEISVAVEPRRDRFVYRFENDSSFDTTELVPHFFRQSYVADQAWLVVRAGYRVGRHRWITEVALAPQTVTFGEDFDTFFQPGGDVVTSGTAGDVSLASWRVSQRFFAYGEPQRLVHLRYVFRRDRSRFHPADRVVTHTQPPSESREFITTRETTISEVHELRIGFTVERDLGGRWRLEGGVEGAPTVIARLTTRLPDNYPGRDIVFFAAVASAAVHAALTMTGRRWFVEIAADADRTWSYLSDRRFTRDGLGVAVRLGIRH